MNDRPSKTEALYQILREIGACISGHGGDFVFSDIDALLFKAATIYQTPEPTQRPVSPPDDARDAARYRWLRTGNDYRRLGPMVVLCEPEHIASDEHSMWGLEDGALDDAVDKARSAHETVEIRHEDIIDSENWCPDCGHPRGACSCAAHETGGSR